MIYIPIKQFDRNVSDIESKRISQFKKNDGTSHIVILIPVSEKFRFSHVRLLCFYLSFCLSLPVSNIDFP